MLSPELFGTPSRIVMDPVHGSIDLFDHEAAVIDQPLFQRLRYIAQTDVLFLVFPGARHTRFEHSLGTMHVAGRFFQSVIRSHIISHKRAQDQLQEPQVTAIRYFFWCVRLAALLHDTGHAPFSHQFELAKGVASILKDTEATLAALWGGENWRLYHNLPDGGLSHEHYSIRCAVELLRTEGLPLDNAVDVITIMEGASETEPSLTFRRHARAIFSLFLEPANDEEATKVVVAFLRKIISGELDADKMDYLLRDAYYSGTSHGVYSLDHLLSMIRLASDTHDRWVGLGIQEKGLGALEDFVHSRFQHYLNVLYHKTVSGFRWLLSEAIHEALGQTDVKERVKSSLTDLEEFTGLTDTFFWEVFRRVARADPSSASAQFLGRRKLTCVRTATDLAKFKIEYLRDELQEQRGRSIVIWESDAKFSNLAEAYEDLRVVVRDRATINKKERLEEVRALTGFFAKFRRQRIVHFFEKPK